MKHEENEKSKKREIVPVVRSSLSTEKWALF
jgi:hypothetical protein